MRIGVPKETASGERRVALVPEVVRKLFGGGHAVVVEAGAGEAAGIPDALFEEGGNPPLEALFGDVKASVADVVSDVHALSREKQTLNAPARRAGIVRRCPGSPDETAVR